VHFLCNDCNAVLEDISNISNIPQLHILCQLLICLIVFQYLFHYFYVHLCEFHIVFSISSCVVIHSSQYHKYRVLVLVLIAVDYMNYNFTARSSYASAVLGIVILSVRRSLVCFMAKQKNIQLKFLHHMKG